MDGYFVFDDVNSADYKIWVKAGGTYGAAARRFTTEVVPGRNGSLTIDDGAYEEKEHTYECHIGDDFPENIEAFRNAIMSKVGRFVLSDSFHSGEYYMARYMRGLEPDVAALAKAGAFTLTFSRDPRRFLVDGDTPQDVATNAETVSGAIAPFDFATGVVLTGVSVDLPVQQSGSGDPSPSNIRPFTGWANAKVYKAGLNLWDDAKFALCNFTLQDTGYYRGRLVDLEALNCGYYLFEKRMPLGRITISFDKLSSSTLRVYFHYEDSDTWQNKSGNITAAGHFSYTSDANRVCDGVTFGTTAGSTAVVSIKDLQITQSDAELPYEAYNGSAVPFSWEDAGTVYCGTIDPVHGKLTVTHELKTITTTANSNVKYSRCTIGDLYYGVGEEGTYCNALPVVYVPAAQIPSDSIRVFNSTTYNAYIAYIRFADADSATTQTQRTTLTNQILAQMEADGHPLQIVFKLTTPVEYDVTPMEMNLLLGRNTLYSDAGDVTVTIMEPAVLINPTLFTAQPLIRVYGQGRVNVGSRSITVSGSYPYIDIDTELGDCTYNGINANSVVSFSGGYPELLPGENYITFFGVTKVEVTPRWWRL